MVEGDADAGELLAKFDHILLDEAVGDEGTEGAAHADFEEGEEVGEELLLVDLGVSGGEGAEAGHVDAG